MRGAVLHAAGDVRCEQRPDPVIIEPTDAIVRAAATCVCGSDLWPYRGIDQVPRARAIGHEFCGIVEQIGDTVTVIQPGQFVIGGFLASDNTCPNCHAGMHSSCLQGVGYDGCQSELIRVPLADGTLVATPELPPKDLVPSLLTLSDVMATGWHAAVSAGVKPGMTVAVVGDGAVGLCGVLAAAQLGAEQVIAMSRHTPRQQLASEFGATDIVVERGEEGIARIKELTEGIGADAVLECVGTGDSVIQALRSTRPWWDGRLGRRSAWSGTSDARPVLAECGRTRRACTGTALSARPDGSGLEPHDRPRQGVRPRPASGTGRRSLPGHGRAPRHQGVVAPVNRRTSPA